MRLLFVADGRSAIAVNWISHFITQGHEVHLASSFPCKAMEGLASLEIIPVAMSGLAGLPGQEREVGSLMRRFIPVKLRTRLRQLLAPSSLPGSAKALQAVFEKVRPELVHAMRIPFEGMLTSQAINLINRMHNPAYVPPFVISVWGNDFTLHAKSSRLMDTYTRETLMRADGLHTDCQRDQILAAEFGFDPGKPGVVLPGGGGVQMDIFYPPDSVEVIEGAFTVINPRGFRAYVRNDTFFQAIPTVLEKKPGARFICPGMRGEGQAERWVSSFGIGAEVDLLPQQTREQMAVLFRNSQVMVSVTMHDGTPNTLLEGMACGCFPIVGDIESLHEWIEDGENGLLVNPADAEALARAILKAIEQPEMRRLGREKNLMLVKERAEYGKVMQKAEEFYQRVIEGS